MSMNPESSGPYKRSGQSRPLLDLEYEPVRHPYVPRWLPWSKHREFMARFHAAVARAKANRGGRWRSYRDELRTRWHILGGLANAYKHGRVGSAWGRSMLAKRGQKALQITLAMRGEMVVEHFAKIGRRGGLAKARKRQQAYVSTLPPERRAILEHQRAVLNGRRRQARERGTW